MQPAFLSNTFSPSSLPILVAPLSSCPHARLMIHPPPSNESRSEPTQNFTPPPPRHVLSLQLIFFPRAISSRPPNLRTLPRTPPARYCLHVQPVPLNIPPNNTAAHSRTTSDLPPLGPPPLSTCSPHHGIAFTIARYTLHRTSAS